MRARDLARSRSCGPYGRISANVPVRRERSELQLVSRVTRERAHRFYFREGLEIACFHFRVAL